MFDIAGSGTNAEFPLAPDYDAIPAKFAETLREEPNFDAQRFAIMGVSFGGNAAVKLAHTRPDLFAAAVNVCGPLHAVFQTEEDEFENVGLMYRLALFDRTHLRQDQVGQLVDLLRGFSLVEQGVLVPTHTKTDTPILSVNARGDYVAPEEDMELAKSSSVDGALIYSGADDHCPQDRYSVMPQIVDWLDTKLQPGPYGQP